MTYLCRTIEQGTSGRFVAHHLHCPKCGTYWKRGGLDNVSEVSVPTDRLPADRTEKPHS